MKRRWLVGMSAVLVVSSAIMAEVKQEELGKTSEGAAVQLFTITNASGASARVITYGATLVSLSVADRDGKFDDVVLGHDDLDGYLRRNRYFGCVVGRYGNRIAGAKFSLNEVEYKLTANNGPNILHGGRRGFDKVVWTGSKVDDQTVEMTYLSKDGEEGFPGNLTARVRYSLTDGNELKIEYEATSEKDTVVNLTNHSYFNLVGHGSAEFPTIVGHEMTVKADEYLPVNQNLIPTGKPAPVAGTPFDFRTAHTIGERIDADHEQIKIARGYDHCFVLKLAEFQPLAVTVYEPTRGRVMEVLTSEPGVQFFSGNGLDGSITGKKGKVYARRTGFCLETQHFPDSPNQPQFPTTTLKSGHLYQSSTVYRFSHRAAAAK
jgi:aldose 1-epimerase